MQIDDYMSSLAGLRKTRNHRFYDYQGCRSHIKNIMAKIAKNEGIFYTHNNSELPKPKRSTHSQNEFSMTKRVTGAARSKDNSGSSVRPKKRQKQMSSAKSLSIAQV